MRFLVIGLVLAFFLPSYSPVEAAKEPETYICPLIALAGAIEVRRCVDEDYSYVFYVNNLGFMIPTP